MIINTYELSMNKFNLQMGKVFLRIEVAMIRTAK